MFTSFAQHGYSMLGCPSFPMVQNQQESCGKPLLQKFFAKVCWTSSINEGSTTNEICWNWKKCKSERVDRTSLKTYWIGVLTISCVESRYNWSYTNKEHGLLRRYLELVQHLKSNKAHRW